MSSLFSRAGSGTGRGGEALDVQAVGVRTSGLRPRNCSASSGDAGEVVKCRWRGRAPFNLEAVEKAVNPGRTASPLMPAASRTERCWRRSASADQRPRACEHAGDFAWRCLRRGMATAPATRGSGPHGVVRGALADAASRVGDDVAEQHVLVHFPVASARRCRVFPSSTSTRELWPGRADVDEDDMGRPVITSDRCGSRRRSGGWPRRWPTTPQRRGFEFHAGGGLVVGPTRCSCRPSG